MACPRLALGMMVFIGLPAAAWAGQAFLERDGVVCIEAEAARASPVVAR